MCVYIRLAHFFVMLAHLGKWLATRFTFAQLSIGWPRWIGTYHHHDKQPVTCRWKEPRWHTYHFRSLLKYLTCAIPITISLAMESSRKLFVAPLMSLSLPDFPLDMEMPHGAIARLPFQNHRWSRRESRLEYRDVWVCTEHTSSQPLHIQYISIPVMWAPKIHAGIGESVTIFWYYWMGKSCVWFHCDGEIPNSRW